MTQDETITLLMALVAERPLQSRDIANGLGCSIEHAYYVANSLRNAGALAKPRYGHWSITEKGRIASALAMHKDPSLHYAFFD